MKKSSFAALMTAVSVAGLLFGGQPVMAEPDGGAWLQLRTVTTTGTWEMRVPPDEVSVTIAVRTSKPELLAAKAENDQKAAQILAVGSKDSIDPSDIQTVGIGIEPKHAKDQNFGKVVSYSVVRVMKFRVKDLKRFDQILNDLVQAGSNSVLNMDYKDSHERQHKDEARRLAAKAAMDKATLLATELGAKLGKVRIISDGGSAGSGYVTNPYNAYNAYISQNFNAGQAPALQGATNGTIGPQGADATVISGAGDAFGVNQSVGPSFAPGELTISVDVQATFDLE